MVPWLIVAVLILPLDHRSAKSFPSLGVWVALMLHFDTRSDARLISTLGVKEVLVAYGGLGGDLSKSIKEGRTSFVTSSTSESVSLSDFRSFNFLNLRIANKV